VQQQQPNQVGGMTKVLSRIRRNPWRVVIVLALISFVWMVISGVVAQQKLQATKTAALALQSSQNLDPHNLADVLHTGRINADSAYKAVHNPPWWIAARIPYLGHSANAVVTATEVARTALDATVNLEQQLRDLPKSTQEVDPKLLLVLGSGAHDLTPAIERAAAQLNSIDLSWTPSAISAPIAKLRDQLNFVLPYIGEVENFTKVSPALLGLEKPEKWVIIFGNTAEARPSGGFPGGWGVIVADKGKLKLSSVESNDRLSKASLYNWADVAGFESASIYNNDLSRVLDMGLSPDFELTGKLFRHLYTQNTPGTDPVGVMVMDEQALAALMKVTGPVEVDGKSMDATQIADYVTKGVYAAHPNPLEKDKVLLGVTKQIFDKLNNGNLGVLGIAKALLPPMAAGHIHAWSADASVQKVIRKTSLSGGVRDPKKFTHIVAIANGGGNKIDAYVQADVQYWGGQCNVKVAYRDSTLRVALTNSAPKSGLPAYVTPRIDKGDLSPKPQGSNREIVFVHAPIGSIFTSATINDESVTPLATGIENDRMVWRFDVELPAQAERLLMVNFSEPALEKKPFARLWTQAMTLPMTTSVHLGPRCS